MVLALPCQFLLNLAFPDGEILAAKVAVRRIICLCNLGPNFVHIAEFHKHQQSSLWKSPYKNEPNETYDFSILD